MKSATSTLYKQLLAQPDVYLPQLKEPNFYSDDDVFKRGYLWYEALFDGSDDADIIGEASKHYTKLPTYPLTVSRMMTHNPTVKLIYLIRHPIDRLVSHYIHEWTQNNIKTDINNAVYKYPELVQYSRYYYQLEPYLEEFDNENIMLVPFDLLISDSQKVLEKVCYFIGYDKKPEWISDSERINASQDRIRRFPLYNLLVESKVASWIRSTFIPKKVRNNVKQRYQITEPLKKTTKKGKTGTNLNAKI